MFVYTTESPCPSTVPPDGAKMSAAAMDSRGDAGTPGWQAREEGAIHEKRTLVAAC